MAYSGSTAASTLANPPNRIDNALLSARNINESTSALEGGSLWTYTSTNLAANLLTTGFFSDADRIGMRNGDVVIAVNYSTESSTGQELLLGIITGVSSNGASVSTKGFISST